MLGMRRRWWPSLSACEPFVWDSQAQHSAGELRRRHSHPSGAAEALCGRRALHEVLPDCQRSCSLETAAPPARHGRYIARGQHWLAGSGAAVHMHGMRSGPARRTRKELACSAFAAGGWAGVSATGPRDAEGCGTPCVSHGISDGGLHALLCGGGVVPVRAAAQPELHGYGHVWPHKLVPRRRPADGRVQLLVALPMRVHVLNTEKVEHSQSCPQPHARGVGRLHG